MSTCQQCGIGNAPYQSTCTTCGTATARSSANQDAQLSALWRIRFDLVEKAGGPTHPLLKQMPLGERFRLMFNIWALLFGAFYYLAKGMWRKAILIVLVSGLTLVLIEMVAPNGELDAVRHAVNGAITILITMLANISYYKKVVLGDNGWW
jgi:hypothetical protein